MNTLSAGSTRLEPLVASHAVEMFSVLSDPAIYEFENQAPASIAALQRRFELLESRRSPDGSEQWLNWVVRVASDELAGYVQATVLKGGQAYVAYELASRFWRRGIATEALGAVLAELRVRYAVREVFAVLKVTNYRSRGLLSKLGFVQLPFDEQAPWRPEADELVMRKGVTGGENA